jgi:hypothetical protein
LNREGTRHGGGTKEVEALKVTIRRVRPNFESYVIDPRRSLESSPVGRGEIASHHEKELTWMDEPHLVPPERRAEQLRKIEPVIEDLYQELFDQDPKNEAESVFMTLIRVRAELAAEEERLNAAR